MQDLFNNREIATAIWFSVLIVLGICWKVTRRGAVDILKAFFKPNLFIPLAVSFLPVVIVVLGLAHFGWWDLSILKETIYWFVGTGLVMFAGFTTVRYVWPLLKKTARETLALVIVLEFFIGFYVFPLWVELLLLPFVTLVVLLVTVAKYQKVEGIELTRKVLGGLMVTIGFVVLVFAAVEFAHDPTSLFTYENLELLLLPVILSFVYMPSVYSLALYSKYELVFNRIDYPMSKDVKNKWTLKLECVKRCGLSVQETSEMIRYLAINLTTETTKAQALKIINEFDSKVPIVKQY